MLSLCLKCSKNADYKNSKVEKTEKQTKMVLSNLQYLAAKNQNLLKNKKQKCN